MPIRLSSVAAFMAETELRCCHRDRWSTSLRYFLSLYRAGFRQLDLKDHFFLDLVTSVLGGGGFRQRMLSVRVGCSYCVVSVWICCSSSAEVRWVLTVPWICSAVQLGLYRVLKIAFWVAVVKRREINKTWKLSWPLKGSCFKP